MVAVKVVRKADLRVGGLVGRKVFVVAALKVEKLEFVMAGSTVSDWVVLSAELLVDMLEI